MKQSNRSQQLYLVNVSVVIMLLVLVGILAVVLPKPTVSEVEKRELAAKPQWSLHSWFSGEYAEQYDAYYADTFPQREQLVSLASKLEQMQGVHPDDVRIHPAGGNAQQSQQLPQPEPEAEQEPQQELAEEPQSPTVDYDAYSDPNAPGNGLSEQGTAGEQVGSLFLYRNMGMQIFGSSQTLSEEYARVISSYAQQLNGVQVYNLIAPTSIEFYLPEKYQGIASSERENIDFVAQQMSDKVISVDAYSQIEKNREDYLYFRTDHHWKPEAAFFAWQALTDELEERYGLAADPALTDPANWDTRVLEHFFLGSQGKRVGSLYAGADDITLYTPKFDSELTYSCPAYGFTRTGPFETSVCFPERVAQQDWFNGNPYTYYAGGDYPIATITNHKNPDGPRVVLLRDSFACALTPFLALSCSELTTIDLRYFEGDLLDTIAGLEPDIALTLYAASTTRLDNLFQYEHTEE